MKGTVSQEELKERLFVLEPQQFLELYRLYEKLGSTVDVKVEMQILRRRLVRMRPRRALTFTRLLCEPFEAFLVNGQPSDPGLVSRRMCLPVARLVRRHLSAAELVRFEQRIAALKPDDGAAKVLLGRDLWEVAAKILSDLRLSRPRTPGDPQPRIGLLIGCLQIGEAMVTLSRGIPEGRVDALDEGGAKLLVRLLRTLPQDRTGHARYLMALLARRLENPASVMAILQSDAGSLPAATRQDLTRMVRGEIEAGVEAGVAKLAAGGHGAPEVVRQAERLLDRLGQISASGAVGPKMQQAGSRIASRLGGMESLSDVAALEPSRQDQIRTLLSVEQSAGLAHAETYRELESEIGNVIRLGARIDRLGVDNPLRAREVALRNQIATRQAALLSSLPQVPDEPGARASARAGLYGLVRMVEMLDGSNAAETLRCEGDRILAG
ncbi:MAG: hypothetical protein P1U65_03890 [Minwuia sp.]|nr:hypothetical protein [Minwuia sp.]